LFAQEVQAILKEGRANGIFKVGNPVQEKTFHWLWAKIIQGVLDEYHINWNEHRTKYCTDSSYPSGTSPDQIMQCLQNYGLCNVSIPVTKAAIDALHCKCLPPHSENFCWVDDNFERNCKSPSLIKGPRPE
ncbi:hypothetical protein K435DRAFT_674984, partial [Dendrothele bispora CBS 962.96]